MATLERARIGDVLETLTELRERFALVMDSFGRHPRAAGLYSAEWMTHLLNIELNPELGPHNFSDLKKVLIGGREFL